jgi:hypothetical protein
LLLLGKKLPDTLQLLPWSVLMQKGSQAKPLPNDLGAAAETVENVACSI